MEDYHLHSNSINNIIGYIKNIEIIENENIVISISNHEDMHIYNIYPIIDYTSRYNIKLVKSYTIQTEDGFDISILNPKNSAIDYYNKLVNKKINTLLYILKNLETNYDININLVDLMDFYGIKNTNYDELYRIDTSAIELYLYTKCKHNKVSIEEIITIVESCNVNQNRDNLIEIFNILKNETICIIDPTVEVINNYKDCFKFVILDLNNKDNEDIINLCKTNNINIKNGSGMII